MITRGRTPEPAEKRFARLAKLMPSGCIEWQGSTFKASGYGRTKLQDKYWRTHRLAWTLANGPIPDGMCVCHKCDNRLCVNIDHLFLGTNDENMADMVAKGRASRGVRHHRAILNEAHVLEIRESKETHNQLAKRFGVTYHAIRHIRYGHIWKFVGGKYQKQATPSERMAISVDSTQSIV